MSKFTINKRVLAAAMAAVLVPSIASAAVVTLGVAGRNHAFEVTNQTVVTAAVNSTFSYDLQAGDILIGRTAGNISVRVTLTGANYTGTAPTVVVPVGQGALVGGAIVSGNVLSFVITPAGGGMTAASMFTITAQTLAVTAATALTTVGNNVVAAVDVRDSGTGITLQTAVTGNVLTSTQASVTTLAAATSTTASVASGKKLFIAGGGFVDPNNLTLGAVTANPNTGGANAVQAFGSGITDNINAGSGAFEFDAVGGISITQSLRDRVSVQVNFADTTGFTQVYLSTAACAIGTGVIANAAGTLAVLTQTGNQYAGSIDVSAATTQTYNICGRVNGTGVIKNQAVTASASIDYIVARDTAFTTAATISTIVYNGTSVDVDWFNPSTNVNQLSFLRVSNPSTTAGLVTITGLCDNGAATSGTATFTLAAGVSTLLTSQALASGAGLTTPLGTCGVAGKVRLNVTGEFAPMKVQNFVKTALSSGEVTTNVNNAN